MGNGNAALIFSKPNSSEPAVEQRVPLTLDDMRRRQTASDGSPIVFGDPNEQVIGEKVFLDLIRLAVSGAGMYSQKQISIICTAVKDYLNTVPTPELLSIEFQGDNTTFAMSCIESGDTMTIKLVFTDLAEREFSLSLTYTEKFWG